MSTKPLAPAVRTADRPTMAAQTGAWALAPVAGIWPITLLIVAAGLVAASGLVHLYLWHVAYRMVPTLGPLFLVQVVAALALSVALLVVRRLVVVAAAALLMIGTIVGFILVTTVGLFGFTLTFISGWAKLALAAELSAVVALGILTLITSHPRRTVSDRPDAT